MDFALERIDNIAAIAGLQVLLQSLQRHAQDIAVVELGPNALLP